MTENADLVGDLMRHFQDWTTKGHKLNDFHFMQDTRSKILRKLREVDTLRKRLALALPADASPDDPLPGECECCEGNGFQCECCGYQGENMPSGYVYPPGSKSAGLIFDADTGTSHEPLELLEKLKSSAVQIVQLRNQAVATIQNNPLLSQFIKDRCP